MQFGNSKAAYVKPKLGKYYVFNGKSDMEAEDFIDNILGGGGTS